MTPLDWARKYTLLGWRPIPVPFREKAPTLRGWQSLRLDARELPAHFNSQPMNLGLLLGEPSGHLVDVDIDAPEAVAIAWQLLPPTQCRSGRPGKPRSHGWYETNLATLKFRDPAGGDGDHDKGMLVEIRSTGCQTIVPPSIHPSGEAIAWDGDGEPAVVAPDELRTAAARLAAAALLARRWPGEGVRHDFALALAGFLLRGGLEEPVATLIVEAAARAARDVEWEDRRRAVRDTAAALAAGEAVTGGPALAEFIPAAERVLAKLREWLGLRGGGAAEHLTDLGNARRFARQHGQDVRYCYPLRSWFVWTGASWRRDLGAEVMARAKATVQSLYQEAAEQADAPARIALAGWARKSEHEARLRAMVILAQSEPTIPVSVEQFDADGLRLNVRNGVVDLRSGAIRPHSRVDLSTKLAPVAYDAAATCPTFERFLARIFDRRERLIRFVQRAIGYSLTADTSEQVFFLLWGHGANGKTTLLKTIFGMLGDYAMASRAEAFMVKGPDAIPNDVARLRGARLVTAVEAEQGQRLAEALVKQATGGDVMTARFMRAEYFDFVPTFKLFLATNHKPIIRGTDLAMWRRIRLIPFTVTIPPAEQDRQLEAKLREEWPGILRWAVEGCLAWQRDGLSPPEEIQVATTAYRAEMDTLGDFLRERGMVAPGAEVTSGALYQAYREWSDAAGERPMSRQALGRRLEERGYTPGRTGTKGRFWTGLRLRTPEDPEPGGDASGPGDAFDTAPPVDTHDARAICTSGNKRHQASLDTEASPRQIWEEV
jgi:putative DNA primase/helicase